MKGNSFMCKKNIISAFVISSSMFCSAQALTEHGNITCEGSTYPSCCTAIATSHGANIAYDWFASKGYYEAHVTLGSYNVHHCDFNDKGSFNLSTESFLTLPNGTSADFSRPTGLISKGTGLCPNNNP